MSGQDWLGNEDKTSSESSLQKLRSARNNVSLTTRSGHGQSEKTRDGTWCHGRHQHRENCETWSEGQEMQGFGHGKLRSFVGEKEFESNDAQV